MDLLEIKTKKVSADGVKFFVMQDGQEVGRIYLYLLRNDLHTEPFGLVEDLFVAEPLRRQGIGTKLVEAAIVAAKECGCYKLIATSRFSRKGVHELYANFGFQKHGVEFRIDFQ